MFIYVNKICNAIFIAQGNQITSKNMIIINKVQCNDHFIIYAKHKTNNKYNKSVRQIKYILLDNNYIDKVN